MQDHPSREPDLAIADLRVWVHERAIPDATDYWDGNWLRATARCQSPGAAVEVTGTILHLSEVAFLLNGCEAMHRTLSGAARLACIEPNLKAELEIDHLGHLAVTIEITPDHMTERHQFRCSLDQTHLDPIIAGCRQILEKYPMRERERLPKERQA